MHRRIPSLVVASLLAACVSAADAQPRRPAPRRPRPSATAPAHPAPGPTTTPAPPDGPRDVRHVTQRASGTWQPQCIATRGCVAPRAIPACNDAPSAPNVRVARPLRFDELVDQRLRLDGQIVSVRGHLEGGGGCTEMACADTAAGRFCCNHCHGGIALTGDARSSMRSVALGLDNDPAFSCVGDDSGYCCGTELPAGDVVVSGTLRAIPNSGGQYRIESPTLCRPSSAS